MRPCSHPVASLLPHAPPMVLLDSVVAWEGGKLEAVVTIRPGIPFFQIGKGVPVHIGIEYMAQACGAYAGLEALKSGEKVRIGFLLGTRRYRASIDWFVEGSELTVSVSEVFRDGPMGVFDCTIVSGNREMALAQLNVYQPSEDKPSEGDLHRHSVER